MSKVKNSQVKNFPLGSNDRVKVINISDVPIKAGNILRSRGFDSSGVLQVGSARSYGTESVSKELFVADYDLPPGVVTEAAVPWKVITGLDTSEARTAGVPLFADDSTGSNRFYIEGVGRGRCVHVGTVLTVHATEGEILLAPQIFGTLEERYDRGSPTTANGASSLIATVLQQPPNTMLLDVGIYTNTGLTLASSGNLILSVETGQLGSTNAFLYSVMSG